MKFTSSVFCVALLVISTAQAQLDWGSQRSFARDSRWTISVGAVVNLEGTVEELTRPYYTASGQHFKQSLAESYSLKDFGVDDAYPMFGLGYSKRWDFFAFKWNLSALMVSSDAVALRDYYLGIGKAIQVNGVPYDHLMIPEGQAFSMDFTGLMTDLTFSFTPFSLSLGESFRLTPSIDIGLVGIGGFYDIDAGEPQGTTVYQNPPVDFVVGGQSKSAIGIAAPQIGCGLEMRVGADDALQWVTSLGVAVFVYDGRTDLFTSADHRKKNADITFLSATAETGLLFPLSEGRAFMVGARVQYISFEGDITSAATSEEEILRDRERFDKRVDFETVTAMVTIGSYY